MSPNPAPARFEFINWARSNNNNLDLTISNLVVCSLTVMTRDNAGIRTRMSAPLHLTGPAQSNALPVQRDLEGRAQYHVNAIRLVGCRTYDMETERVIFLQSSDIHRSYVYMDHYSNLYRLHWLLCLLLIASKWHWQLLLLLLLNETYYSGVKSKDC